MWYYIAISAKRQGLLFISKIDYNTGYPDLFLYQNKNPFLILLKDLKKGFYFKRSAVLLSRSLATKVPSALKDLTSVFGMGTGISPQLYPPEIFENICSNLALVIEIFVVLISYIKRVIPKLF